MSLIVVGSVAYDGVETPHGKVDRMLGGAATYIALAAQYFTPVGLVAVVGDDFAQEDTDLLASRRINLDGLERVLEGARKGALEEPLEAVFNIFQSHGTNNCTGRHRNHGGARGPANRFE